MLKAGLALVADETRYRGWTRIGFHGLLILGIFLVIFSAYVPWFLYPATPLAIPLKTYVGPVLRDGLSVVLQYYLLVFLFKHFVRRPVILIPGLGAYYLVLFTFYYFSAYIVKKHFGLPDDYSGSVTHFERFTYGQALLHPGTFFHMLFIIERAFYPLAAKLLIEVYRRQVRNARLQQQYAQLELDFIKSQVNPHFLFNVLNSIYALTEEENPQAAGIVQQLSNMMRYALYETKEPLVPLNKELSFIRDYVALEQLRSAKRLELDANIPDNVDGSWQITPFILITFIENAFKHGVQSTTKRSWVKVKVEIRENSLLLFASNSKPCNSQPTVGGLGLANVRKRLNFLKEKHSLNILDEPNQYSVTLQLQLVQEMKKLSV